MNRRACARARACVYVNKLFVFSNILFNHE